MTYPSREHTLVLLREWQKHHAAVTKMMDGIKATIGLDPGGPLHEMVWRLFDAYTDTLAAEVGDMEGWLEWWYTDNDMGKRGHVVTINGKQKKATTLRHLFSFIHGSRKWGEA